jgi:hypothetical protein
MRERTVSQSRGSYLDKAINKANVAEGFRAQALPELSGAHALYLEFAQDY